METLVCAYLFITLKVVVLEIDSIRSSTPWWLNSSSIHRKHYFGMNIEGYRRVVHFGLFLFIVFGWHVFSSEFMNYASNVQRSIYMHLEGVEYLRKYKF